MISRGFFQFIPFWGVEWGCKRQAGRELPQIFQELPFPHHSKLARTFQHCTGGTAVIVASIPLPVEYKERVEQSTKEGGKYSETA